MDPTQNQKQDENSQNQENDYDFNGAPIATNDSEGVQVYPKKDSEGNWYMVINLPLGLGNARVFMNENGHEGIKQSFNKLVDYYNED